MRDGQVELSAIQMQQKKLRQLQQLQQARIMSYQGHPDSQAYSQNYQNNPSDTNNTSYRLELSLQQAAYLTKLLPQTFSFQLETKPLKRSSTAQKNMREAPKVPTETKKKSTRDESRTSSNKGGSLRAQKSNNNRFTQEIQNAVYQKYTSQRGYQRNSFENVSQALKPCVKILSLLKNSKTSWPFREPVDPIAYGIPHYAEIIKEPMDLSTVEVNLRTNQYVTPTQFHADVAKIIKNSYTFNYANAQFTRATVQFEAYYRKITTEPSSDMIRSNSHDLAPEFYPSKSISLEAKKSRKQKDLDYSNSSVPVISMAEKKELGLNIKKLPKEDMKGILDIVKEGTGKIIGEFDLKQLDPSIIRKLQNYVKEKMSGQGKSKATGLNKSIDNEQESSFEVGEEDES